MLPFLTEHFGNPSGAHSMARASRRAVEDARDLMAPHLGCTPGELVFTAGGTEADNLAVLGAHGAARSAARRGAGPGTSPPSTMSATTVVCSAVEHHAVLRAVASVGGKVAPVDSSGRVDLDRLSAALDGSVALVSVMTANNEVGTIQALGEVVELVRSSAPQAVMHTDAVAAACWLDLAEATAGADLVSVSAHKFGGPKGVGALVVRHGVRIAPVLHGGSQERDRRPGTHDVAGIVGMAAALEAAVTSRGVEVVRIAALRDRLVDGILSTVSGVRETGGPDRGGRVPGICHLLVDAVDQEELLVLLDDAGICASAGAACASGALEPSHVLLAMGLAPDEARSGVRFSLGHTTTADDVDSVVAVLPKIVERLRS